MAGDSLIGNSGKYRFDSDAPDKTKLVLTIKKKKYGKTFRKRI